MDVIGVEKMIEYIEIDTEDENGDDITLLVSAWPDGGVYIESIDVFVEDGEVVWNEPGDEPVKICTEGEFAEMVKKELVR